ncbi:MAG TPA: hypothetical protein VJ885_15250, partial [Thermoanaerobaculia bacterium]|nr:hypothetical protein [Thermoanaerobaculia bacterium]
MPLLLFVPLLILALTPAGLAAQANQELGADPTLWPEPQRAFFQDGPGLLLTPEQRTNLRTLNEGARERAIQQLLKDPVPATPANELIEGIERRRRLADSEIASPSDVRWQILFLNGRPVERTVVDCGQSFKPLEVWSFPSRGIDATTGKAVPRRLVVYRPGPGEPFRLWIPSDSKRALYIPQMEYWLMQWEELRGRIQAVRFDLQTCRESTLKVDEATGVPGLTGARAGKGHTVKPIDNSVFLQPPRELADWARLAMATDAPPAPAAVKVRALDVVFPEREGQRMRMHAQIQVDTDGLQLAPPETEKAQPLYGLTVQVALEQDGKAFDEFRMRFRPPVPPPGEPLVLMIDRLVRPNQPFLMRLRISEEQSEAETRLSRGFLVPEKPTPGFKMPAGVATGE